MTGNTPAAAQPPLLSALAPAVLSSNPPRELPRDEALDWVRRMHHGLNKPSVAAEIVTAFGNSLFTGKSEDRPLLRPPSLSEMTWRHAWPHDRALVFSVGLLPIVRPRSSKNEPHYRLAVRIQSPRRIRQRSMEAIRAAFDQKFNDLVSLRWTSPAILLATNPDGKYLPWRGPNEGRFDCGAPANIAGGAVGALTLPFHGKIGGVEGYWGLASGHTINDDDRGGNGDFVYSPPQPLDGYNPRAAIGTVRELRNLDRLSLLTGQPLAGSAAAGRISQEYALLAIEPAHLPVERRMVGARQYAPKIFGGDLLNGLRVLKAAARSPECHGTVSATDFILEAYNPMTSSTVVAHGLMEVELDERNVALSGDSGALLCVERNHGLEAAAQLMSGVRTASLRPSGRSVSAIYASPLSAIPHLNELDLF